MNKVKFYVCPICDNVITSTNSIETSCCGRKLQESVVNQKDNEHYLNVKNIGDESFIEFKHDMSKEHYLSFISVVDYNTITLTKLYPEQGNEIILPRIYRGKIYFYCSNHGLFEN